MSDVSRCGYIAIIGKPNVGKSTLLNHILGSKISITSTKPQTTRQQILGIKTVHTVQAIYIDTPGWQQQHKNALNHYMNRAATAVINDVDVIIFMVVAKQWQQADDAILEKIKSTKLPLILVINKIDRLPDKQMLLPLIETYQERADFAAVVPLYAKSSRDVGKIERVITNFLPIRKPLFPPEQITDRDQHFLVAEIVREKIMRLTGNEIPYSIALELEEYQQRQHVTHISLLIIVTKRGQKAIIIGNKGERLKEIGRQARLELENRLQGKVFLRLWVKVREDWVNDEHALRNLGYYA